MTTYAAIADPYCYPGTSVLKNLPGLKSQAALDRFETALTAQRSAEPLPVGRLSVRHYQAIHRHLFQDVFPWAGRFRTVRIAKNNSMFCYPEHIAKEMKKLFASLRRARHSRGGAAKAFSRDAAHFLAELNAIHPFREGNGRTQLAFLTLLAETAGHPLVMKRLDPDRVMQAMIASFDGREAPLARLIEDLVYPA